MRLHYELLLITLLINNLRCLCFTSVEPKVYRRSGKIKRLKSTETLTEQKEVMTPSLYKEDGHLGGMQLPFSMIVGQDRIKSALQLLAVDPQIGGVLISGCHGSGKSCMARSLHRLLPKTITRIKGSVYNIDPDGKHGIDSFLLQQLCSQGKKLKDFDVEEIDTPFCTVPLNVMEDSLVGTIDLEKSVEVGYNVFLPGILAKAHRGLLYIDDVNLMDENIVDILFDVMSEGVVKVEREGLSVQYPCTPIIVATFNEDEGEIREHLRDRIAISLSTDEKPLSIMQRVEATDNIITFTDRSNLSSVHKLVKAEKSDDLLSKKILDARLLLDSVEISHHHLLHLCEEATRAGCEGQRAEIFAAQVAKSNAAYYGRKKVNVEDLRVATTLVIAPRSKYFGEEFTSDDFKSEGDAKTDEQPVDSPMSPLPPDETGSKDGERDNNQENVDDEKDSSEDVQEREEDLDIKLPTEFMFSVTGVPLDPDLLNFARMSKKGKGGKGSRVFNLIRGRYVKPIFPLPGKRGKLAIGPTLRAAAPFQNARKSRAIGTPKEGRAVLVEKDDFRIKRMKRKAGALVIFVVDASGSMALNRMDAAKGAAMALLSEAYKMRNKISLIAIQGQQAEVLVPPTKSTALTKQRLEGLPCYGGSPLAHALVTAARVGVNECNIKKDVSRVKIILISDCRANIPLFLSEGEMPSIKTRPTKQYLQEEVLSCAKQFTKLDFDVIVIDTEDKYISAGIAKEIARVSLGKYYSIDPRNTAAIRAVTKNV